MLFAVIAAFSWLCSASFAGTLKSYVPVTLMSPRSGLVMESGAKVTMRGVPVGRVGGIDGGRDPVRLKLELFPGQVAAIPANVTAQIRASTVFGAKYVDLIYPENPSEQHISAGAVLTSHNVTTEVNTVFQNLVDVLHQIEPTKLNAVLTATADAVRGRGEQMGQAIGAADRVLAAINPRMTVVRQDWRSFSRTADAYSAAAPDILSSLDAGSTTSATITSHSDELNALLLNAIGLSDAGIDLLVPSRDNMVRAVNTLEPTADLLFEYNPVYTCLLTGAKWYLDNAGYEIAGGNGRTILLDDTLLFGDDPYRFPENLPIVAAKGGPGGKPGCGSLPDASKNYPVRQLVTNTGFGTGLDNRPNPGIGHPWWLDFFPVTRAVPETPRIRSNTAPAIGPIPYPGAPPYGAPLFGPDGTPLYPEAPAP